MLSLLLSSFLRICRQEQDDEEEDKEEEEEVEVEEVEEEEGDEEEDAPAEEEIDEEELAKMMKPQLQTNIYPESVISLQATQLFLKRRAKTFLESLSKAHDKWHISKMHQKIE